MKRFPGRQQWVSWATVRQILTVVMVSLLVLQVSAIGIAFDGRLSGGESAVAVHESDDRQSRSANVSATVDASITWFTPDSGTYTAGDTYTADAKVENTGDTRHTFFVGFDVRGPEDNYYNNGGTTGKTVTLDPGEATWTTVSWTVQDDIPTGSYDTVVAVWKESDPDNLQTRLDDVVEQNVFSVSEPGAVEGYVTDEDGDPIEGARVYLDSSRHTRTDENGYYSFSDVGAGDHEVYVTAGACYETPTETVSVTGGQTTRTDFPLEAESYTVGLQTDPVDASVDGEGTYDCGDDVTISTPETKGNYEFVAWETPGGDLVSEQATFTLEYLTTDTELVARYRQTGEPDLTITDVRIEPSDPTEGDSVTFYVEVRNRGEVRATNVETELVVDNDVLRSDGVDLEPGESTTLQLPSWSATAGSFDVSAEIDYGDEIAEEDESNNDYSTTVSVTDPKPDLTVVDVEWRPAPPTAGEAVQFRLTIRNTGEVTAETVETRVLVDGNAVTMAPTTTLDPGETYTTPWSGSYEFTEGTHDVVGVVDPDDNIVESDETDNSVSEIVSVDQAVGTVTGRVTDSDGNPVEGALVTLDDGGQQTRTDSEGRYRFEGVTAGDHTVSVSAGEYESAETAVTVEAGTTVSADVVLQPTAPAVAASIETVSLSSGTYEAGEVVTTTVTVKNTGRETHTFYTGYSFLGPDDETYDGEGTTHSTVELAPGESKTVELTWTVPESAPAGEYSAVVAVWESKDGGKLSGRLAEQRPGTVSVEPSTDLSSVRVSVTDVNGEPYDGTAVDSEDGVTSITVSLTDDNGNPVTGVTPQLSSLRMSSLTFTVEEIGPGTYQFTSDVGTYSGTGYQYFELSVNSGGKEIERRVSVAVDDTTDSLPVAVEGWRATDEVTVLVDGEEYTAVRMVELDSETRQTTGRDGWVVYGPDGSLVTDEQTLHRAAKTATVSDMMRAESHWESYLSEEYPNNLQFIVTSDYVLEFTNTVRDIAAETLGMIASVYATGGASVATKKATGKAAKLTAKQATKRAAGKLAKGVFQEMRSTGVSRADFVSDPMGTYNRGIRLSARAEMRESARQSEQAGRILREHPDNEPWSYRESKRFWSKFNESMTDGVLWSEVRAQQLPEEDEQLETQLTAIGKNFVDGAGLPVTTLDSYRQFRNAVVNGELGQAMVAALQQTSSIRQRLHNARVSFDERPSEVTDAVQAAGGGTADTTSATSSTASETATVEVVSEPQGTFNPGDNVTTTVRVQNTGQEPERFFVGYSVAVETGNGTVYFDNNGTTGRFVSLAPGETKTVELDWRVDSYVPLKTDYNIVTAVWDEFPSQSATRFDGVTRSNAFRVEDTGTTSVTELTATEVGDDGLVEVTATLQSTRSVGTRVPLTLQREGTVLDSRVAYLKPGETKRVVFEVQFEENKEHRLTLGGESTTVRVSNAESASWTADQFDDGQYEERWTIREQDDETIRETDDILRHQSPRNYNNNGDMVTKQTFQADGTVTISVRQRQADTNYWGTGFAILLDEYGVTLKEHKWSNNNRLAVFTEGGPYRVADATSDDGWITYNLTINFDTTTLVSVSRGSQRWELDVDLPETESETFQIELGVGRGHETLYDFVRVVRDPNLTSIERPPAVGSSTKKPTDPDGDGVYEDVNGDGSVTVEDARLLFDSLSSESIETHQAAFDVNGDGVVDAGDAQALYAEAGQ